MRPSWRRRAVIGLLALLGLNLAVYAAYTLPRRLQEESLSVRAEVLRREVQRDRQRVDDLRRRKDTVQSNAGDVTAFYGRLGRKESLLRIREEVAAMAAEQGLKVGARSYSVEDVKGSSDLVRFEMHMPIAGSYRQLTSLLDRLERSARFVTVDRIQLREGSNSGSGPSLDLDLVLSVFYRGTPSSRKEAS